MDRRDSLKKGGAVLAGGVLADTGIFERAASAAANDTGSTRPNIVFILVDEMRFPTAFPQGVNTPEEFLKQHMPNVCELWRHGVTFHRYYSSGNACSPARATIATGLYPHRQWLLATRTTFGPALQLAFPTYGKLLRALGYETPYIGKWHCPIRLSAASRGTSRATGSRATPIPTRPARTGRARWRTGTTRPGDAVAAAPARPRSTVLPDSQLRQPSRQAVLLGRIGGQHLRTAVHRPAAPTIRQEVPVGSRRVRPTVIRFSRRFTELGVAPEPLLAPKAAQPAAVPGVPGSRVGWRSRRSQRLRSSSCSPRRSSRGISEWPWRRTAIGSGASTCTRSR
jgi:hypothetical protein